MMTNNTIYLWDTEDTPLNEALNILTDEYIDDGNVCNQTVIDLRNALAEALEKLNLLK